MPIRKGCITLVVGFVAGLAFAAAALLPDRCQAGNPPTATAPSVKDEALREDLSTQQKRVWQALQQRDADSFKKLVPADFAGINRNGVRYGRDDGLQFLTHYRIAKFALSDIRVQSVSRDTANLTYQVQYQIASVGGDEILDLATRNVAVFARRNGTWYCVFGQETPVGE
jgi:hypothetical protein